MAESKYGHLVKTLSFQESTMGGANARELVFVDRVDKPYGVMQVGLAAEIKSSYID